MTNAATSLRFWNSKLSLPITMFSVDYGASQVAQWNHRRREFDPWAGNILWRRKWQPTPVSLPGKSNGQRSLLLLLSRFSRVRLFATPWTAAQQAPPPMGFSRIEEPSRLQSMGSQRVGYHWATALSAIQFLLYSTFLPPGGDKESQLLVSPKQMVFQDCSIIKNSLGNSI